VPGQRWCQGCRNAYNRRHRRLHRDLAPEQRRRANVRSYANVYKRRGKLQPKPCGNCGAADAEMRHDDYTQPLKVRWLCRPCRYAELRPVRRVIDRAEFAARLEQWAKSRRGIATSG
jgi:hypothetical protein